MMPRHLLAMLLLAALPLGATGCLGDSPFVPKIEDTNFDASLGVNLAASTKTASGLYYRDIVVGTTGIPAAAGDSAFTTYKLFLRTGTNVQNGSFGFELGADDVIPGYDEGVTGMLIGGKRQLIIPPHLGYGSLAVGTSIPPNSILVYEIDLTDIH